MRNLYLTLVTTCLFALLATMPVAAGAADGTPLDAVRLLDNGPPAERFDIVLIGDGYRDAEQARFAADAQALADLLLATPPFADASDALNIWRIDVASFQSGADDPFPCTGASGLRVATYFDASFCSGRRYRRLLTVSHGLVLDTVDSIVPEWEQIVAIVNSPVPGGLGGSLTVTSVYPGWERAVLHQIGHAAFGLADEYDYFLGCGVDDDRRSHPPIEPAAANVTVNRDLATVKWADLIDPEAPVVGTTVPDCSYCDPRPDPFPGRVVVGLYEGAHYFHCDAFRPAFHCAMRDLTAFCPVCSRRILETLEPFRAPRVNEPPLCSAGGPYHAECGGPTTVVRLDGSASSDPDGDRLEFEWSGGFAGGSAAGIDPLVEFAGPGSFTVELRVRDGEAESACTAEVVVEDTAPPALEVALSPTILWPVNHELVPITASLAVGDVCDPAPRVRLLEVRSSEPDRGRGDGATDRDVHGVEPGTDDREFLLRAERSGLGEGRIYTAVYRVDDAAGNASEAEAEVRVPKSQGDPRGGRRNTTAKNPRTAAAERR